MRMDTRLPMMVQPPDFVNALAVGTQAAGMQNDVTQQNALRNFLAQSGGAVMQGDQNALAQLAQFDPNAALGVMDARQGMDQRALSMDAMRQDMDLQRQQFRMQAEQAAAQMTAAERAEQAAMIDRTLSGAAYFYSQGDQAGYEGFLAQNGLDPAQHPFEQFPAIAATYGEAFDAFQTFTDMAAPEAQDERYRAVGGNVWDWGDGTQPPTLIAEAPGQETVVFGPDGQPIMVQGQAGAAQRFTEGQSRDNVYATRARGALEVLEPVADALADRGSRIADMVPFGIGREFQSPDYQVAQNAGNEFLQAILRKDTGAAITADEQTLYGATYLPQPGDTPEVLEAKRQARIRAIAAIEAGMMPSQIVVRDQALVNAAAESAETTAAPVGDGGFVAAAPAGDLAPAVAPTQITPEVVLTMPPEAYAAWFLTVDPSSLPDDVLDAMIAREQANAP